MATGVQPEIIAAATAAGGTVLRAAGATIIILLDGAPAADDLLPKREAAELAQCSVRSLDAGIRTGELAAYGKQRSRSVRRSDLLAWIESRRVRPVAGADDDDIARRMRSIAARRSA